MTSGAPPEVSAHELATRLDRGERVQLLDVRSRDRVSRGRATLGAGLEFRAVPARELARLPSLDPLHIDPTEPLLVICGHGNSSARVANLLRDRGLDARSVAGGMAAWDAVYLSRRLPPTRALEHIVQIDRVGKGALSYVLASEGDAVVVDPGRHLDRYEQVLQALGATAAAVVDTHMHADYLSGARDAAHRWGVPYFLHTDDARSPYDDTPGRLRSQPLAAGDTIALGRATLHVEHVPGHTLGSIALLADDSLALTGDFLFVRSVGRPDLGGHARPWAELLWRSLERARRQWPPDLLVLPAHYSDERERRADRIVGARLDVILATNPAAMLPDQPSFLRWVTEHELAAPASYRTMKLANLGLVELTEPEAEEAESGANQCAVDFAPR
jgi:glyoxylase-like metal-dependent hydrolase (beta-lactamase superfamily II)